MLAVDVLVNLGPQEFDETSLSQFKLMKPRLSEFSLGLQVRRNAPLSAS